MTQIARLHTGEIANGQLINAEDLDDELNQLVNEANAQDTRVTTLESGNTTISGNKTLSGTTTLSGAVSVTGSLNVALASDPVSPTDGMLWYNATSDIPKIQVNSVTKTIATTDNVLTRSYLSGLALSTAADANNDLTIAIGSCRDSTDAASLALASALTKQSDAAWAVGTNAGGMDTGTKPTSATLHIWLIKRLDTGVVDALYSISETAPTMPTNYTVKRRIGSRRTDSSGNIINMHQYGDVNYFDTVQALDVDDSAQGTTAITRTLLVPLGLQFEAIINAMVTAASGVMAVSFTNLDLTDTAPSITATPLSQLTVPNGAGQMASGQLRIITNTSGQIRTRSTNASTTVRIATAGWVDRRGKDD